MKAIVFLPSPFCVICQKTIKEIGGKRIIAQHLRGITLSSKPRDGGDPEYPCKSIRLSLYPLYLVVWGEGLCGVKKQYREQ